VVFCHSLRRAAADIFSDFRFRRVPTFSSQLVNPVTHHVGGPVTEAAATASGGGAGAPHSQECPERVMAKTVVAANRADSFQYCFSGFFFFFSDESG
jgi:hypothetical protein